MKKLTLILVPLIAAYAHAQSLEYEAKLKEKKNASLEDVCMIFYAVVVKEDPELKPEVAVKELIKKGIFPEEWMTDLKENASLGQVSYLICQTLNIKGGVTMRVLGPSRRYCYKECVRLAIVKSAGPHSRISGRDLLSIASRVIEKLEPKIAK